MLRVSVGPSIVNVDQSGVALASAAWWRSSARSHRRPLGFDVRVRRLRCQRHRVKVARRGVDVSLWYDTSPVRAALCRCCRRSGYLSRMSVRLIEERRFHPPRLVEVEHGGRWWPGLQRAWRVCDDGRGWRADVEYVVEYVVEHEWGRGRHMPTVPPERVRPLS